MTAPSFDSSHARSWPGAAALPEMGLLAPLARALASVVGDPSSTLVAWLADELGDTVVLLTGASGGCLVPRAVAHPDPLRAISLRRVARSLIVQGQSPELPLPVVGELRRFDAPQLAASSWSAWSLGDSRSRGVVAALTPTTYLLTIRAGDRDALSDDQLRFLDDALSWSGAFLHERAGRLAAERQSDATSTDLAAHLEELASARQTLDRVGLSHGNDLRSIARRLQAWVRFASAPDLDRKAQAETLRRIGRTADQLAARVGDLLDTLDEDLSNRNERELVDLNGVAAWVRDTLVDEATRGGSRLVAGTLPSVHGSPSDFRRILTELVANAFQHAGRQVEVVITAHGRPDGALDLRVTDDGCGVPARDRDVVFDPGFQTGGGSGFGLTRLRLLVTSRGGTITISDADGGGCEVCVVLPGVMHGMRCTPGSRLASDV